MSKKWMMILSSALAVIFVFFGLTVFYFKTEDNRKQGNEIENMKHLSTVESRSPDDMGNKVDQKDEVTRTEGIPVGNNSPEFGLTASLYETSLGKILLKLEYYSNGSSVVKELDNTQIPEITGIFENRDKQIGDKKGYRVRNIYLNALNSKVYFILEGSPYQEGMDLCIYSLSLNDFAVKKLFQEKCDVGELSFSKDSRYLAFDTKFTDPLNQKVSSYVGVVKCDNDEWVVSKNRAHNQQAIGGLEADGSAYYYSFISYYSNIIIKMNQTIRPKNPNKPEQQNEVLYDLEKNIFVNPDGSQVRSSDTNTGSDSNKEATESNAGKALGNFFLYMSSDKQFAKAYNMLDNGFKIKTNILKQFGFTEIKKSDLDLNNYSLYSNIFKAAKIEKIVDEKVSGDTSSIYFHFAITLDEGQPVRQPMIAHLKKFGKGWKILSVVDGDADKKHFKK